MSNYSPEHMLKDRANFNECLKQKLAQVACAKCHGPVASETEDAFRRISGRGEAYCAECWGEKFPQQMDKQGKAKPKKAAKKRYDQATA